MTGFPADWPPPEADEDDEGCARSATGSNNKPAAWLRHRKVGGVMDMIFWSSGMKKGGKTGIYFRSAGASAA